MQVWLYAICIIAAVCGTWFLTFLFSRYYIDPRHKSFLTLFITSLALAVAALTLALIPIDVYTVTSGLTSAGAHADVAELSRLQDGLRVLYYGFYLAAVVFCFILLPFAYFYFEEDAGEEGSTPGRCFRATKFTIGFAVVFGILIGCGFIVKQGSVTDDGDWRDRLERNFTNIEQLVSFTVSILALLGLAAFVINAGYGLVMIPAGLWRSRAASSAVDRTALLSEQDSLQQQIRAKEEEITYIHTADQAELGQGGSSNRYGGATQFRSQYAREAALSRGAGSSREAREATAAVRRKQRELERQREVNNAMLEHDASAAGRCASVWRASAPLRYVVALLACLLTAAIVAQVLLATVDRVKHSKCRWSCGFALPNAAKPFFNPLDQFFVAVSPAFPLDLVFFGGLILYLFICAITGLAALGVRVLCIKLFPIRAHGTPANGLVMGTWLLMFVALVINQQMLTLAPQYSSFGKQFYIDENDHKVACSPSVTGLRPGHCVFTELAKFLYKTNNRMPFFGVVQFFASCLLLVVVAVSLIYALCRSKASWNASKAQSDDPDAVGYVGYGQ